MGDTVKKSVVTKLLGALAEIGTAEVKKTGVFSVPGLVRIKTKKKPPTKAGKKMMFGQEVVVKAKPGKTVVKAFQWLCSRALLVDLHLAKDVMRYRVGSPTTRFAISTCWPGGGLATTAIVYMALNQNRPPACHKK